MTTHAIRHDIELPRGAAAERVPSAFPTVFAWDYRIRHEELLRLYEKEMTSTELKEREEFVIEATMLMRDRLLMEEIWPRLGLDERVWLPWSMHTPFMVGFRQILFSKIVPNLRRLGLLTPRVRKAFADLEILEFESLPDSTVDAETAMPPALMTFFARLQAAGIQLPGVAGA